MHSSNDMPKMNNRLCYFKTLKLRLIRKTKIKFMLEANKSDLNSVIMLHSSKLNALSRVSLSILRF